MDEDAGRGDKCVDDVQKRIEIISILNSFMFVSMIFRKLYVVIKSVVLIFGKSIFNYLIHCSY